MWNLLGGYHPERLPIALLLAPCDDLELLMGRLTAIRDAIASTEG